MHENKLEFYFIKWKLLLSSFFSIIIAIFGIVMLYITIIEQDYIFSLVALFVSIIMSSFAVANLLKAIRNLPYVIVTDEYIQLDPHTKSEATLYFTNIDEMKVQSISSKKVIGIHLPNKNAYFRQLTFHNKVRLCMNYIMRMPLYTLNPNVIPKQDREVLYMGLLLGMEYKDEPGKSIVKEIKSQIS